MTQIHQNNKTNDDEENDDDDDDDGDDEDGGLLTQPQPVSTWHLGANLNTAVPVIIIR